MIIQVGSRAYGPIKRETSYELPDEGYIVILGENNVGKSSLLQLCFKQLMPQIKHNQLCYIPKNRDFISKSIQPGNDHLANFNKKFVDNISIEPFRYSNPTSFDFSPLFSLLINDSSLFQQIGQVTNDLKVAEFGHYDVKEAQSQILDGVSIDRHGSGVRQLMPIYGALSHADLKYVIIDEPEASLEAGKQKRLKERLINAVKEQGKIVIIATHSHLFLNEDNISNNLILINNGDNLDLRPVASPSDFHDIAFKMLGNSLSDLYLPDNFLFVEGASDQVILQKIADLIKPKGFELRIISCTSFSEALPTVADFERNLRPVIEHKSPYAKTLVVMLDKPEDNGMLTLSEELQKLIGERYIELGEKSIEEHLDEKLYTKAGLNKDDELQKITDAKDHKAKALIKEEISNKIADTITQDDLPLLETLVGVVRLATDLSFSSK